MKKLTELEERFCLKYFENHGNGRQAVLDAGYKQTENAAGVTSTRLLKKANVQDRLAKLRAKQEKRVENNADDIVRELNRLGYSDLTALIDERGAYKPVHEWPLEIRRAVASIKVREEFEDGEAYCEDCGRKMHRTLTGYTKEVKLWPKDRALGYLGQNKKLFTQKVEHSGTLSLEEMLAASHESDAPKDAE